MKKVLIISVLFLFMELSAGSKILNAQVNGTTIQQKLSLVLNSGTNGGEFTFDYQIKGAYMSPVNTLASLNADISYDSNTLRFISGINWESEIDSLNGYDTGIKSNPSDSGSFRWVRISINAPYLNSDGSGQIIGFSVPTEYSTIVRLNFIIIDNTKSITVSIESETNQVGFFLNPFNSPNTFEISDQILLPPENICNQPLPVNLESFSAGISGRNVKLEWKTAYEENNSGFDIEKKETGKEGWNKIGFVKGNINKNSVSEYHYTDSKLVTGKYNYRLKQIDLNGNYQYYELIQIIKIGIPDKFSVSQNYPNPFNSSTKIDFDLPQNCVVNLILYDITGREIKKIINNINYNGGYHTIDFNTGDLSSGTYFYRFTADNFAGVIRKLIIIK